MKEFFKTLGRRVTGRKGIGNTMTVVIIIAVVMLNVLAYTVTNAFGLYLYSPTVDDFSISGSTDELFADAISAGKKVTITFCYPEDKLEKHDTGNYVLRTAREFEAKYPEFIELRFINLLTKMDEYGKIVDLDVYSDVVCSNVIDEQSGRVCKKTVRYVDVDQDKPKCSYCGADLDLKKDVVRNFSQNSVIFETGEGENFSYRVLTDKRSSAGFVDFYTLDSNTNVVAYNGEEVMASMISWVLHKNHPIAYFTQNHGESAEIALTNLLACAGYYVEVINLRKSEIPDDAGMVIISNPTVDFDMSDPSSETRGEINKLEDYLKGGGKLYAALDPYVKELPNLEGMLSRWGITMSKPDNENKDVFVRNIIKESANAITPDGYTFVASHADNEVSSAILDKVTKYGNDRILVSQVAALELDASKGAMPLLVSGSASLTYAGGEMTDSAGSYPVAAYSVRAEEGGKSSTVLVIPTAYITSTDSFLSTKYSNKNFLYATFEELFGAHKSPRGCNQILYKTKILENLTMGTARIYTAIILAVPAALTVVGIITITRRKNR